MEYISHEDYKKMLGSFGKEAPKKALNEMHTMQKDDGPSEFHRLPADVDEGLEKEGNAFTAGLAKTKKGGEFKVGNKTFKDKTNYDASVSEELDSPYDGGADDLAAMAKDEEGAAEILRHVKGDIYKVKTPKGEVIDLEFELERGMERVDNYGYEGNIISYDDDYEYILPVALVPIGGGDYDINPYYVEFTAIPLKKKGVQEYQFDQMYPDDPGPFEGIDAKLKEFLAKEDDTNWEAIDNDEAEENETDNGIEEDDDSSISYKFQIGDMVTVPTGSEPSKPLKILDRKPDAAAAEDEIDFKNTDIIDIDWNADEGAWESVENKPWYCIPNHDPEYDGEGPSSIWWPESEITKYAGTTKLGKAQEGINLPSSQPTGPSIKENKRPLSHLSPEERDQLRQYVETIKTVKEEINKMINKSGMEEGGDMTGLIMRPTMNRNGR